MNKRKILILSAIFSILFVFSFIVLRFSPYPEFSDFRKRPVSTRIYDSEGKLIQITALDEGLHHEFIPIDEIPAFVQEAFIKAEDRHFYSHHGIDFISIFRALFQNTSEGRTVSGASTISMQLARIIRPSKKRNLAVKIRESFDALRLELRLSKKEILELYLNNVPFGFNTEGAASAARYFFSKELSALSEEEAKLLSQIPRRPSLYNPLINSSRKAYSYPFEMPHFVRYLSNLPDSPVGKQPDLHTSAVLKVQNAAEDLLRRSVEQYAANRLTNGAILVCDTQSGAILAWVGSADFFDDAHSGQVDGVLSLQQPGSSMKPFLYALALEKGFSPSSVLSDIPMEFGFEKLYAPQNFNNRFNGPVRLRVALASSLNVPAVFLLNEIGIEKLNNNSFTEFCHDGDTWLIYIIYDDKDIAAEGHCTMPRELRNLISYLNSEWNLPICKMISYWVKEKNGKMPKPRYGQRKWLDDDWRLNNREDFVKLKMESLTN